MRFGFGVIPHTIDFSRAFDGSAVMAWLQNITGCDRMTAHKLVILFQENKTVVTFYL